MAGCNAGATRDAIAYAERARDLGYDAIMLAAPYTSLPTQRELAAHYAAIARAAGLPVILYNYPARAGVEIGFDCLDAWSTCPRSSASRSRPATSRGSSRCAAGTATGSRSCAAPTTRRSTTSPGACARWLAGTSNVLPRHHAAIMDAANSGDHVTAYRLFDGILPWVQLMEAGSYNQKAKLGLAHQGIADRRRPPAAPAARGRATPRS